MRHGLPSPTESRRAGIEPSRGTHSVAIISCIKLELAGGGRGLDPLFDHGL